MEVGMPESWSDGNPFFLFILSLPDWIADENGNTVGQTEREQVIIDLGESGWVAKNADWMRRPARWWLVEKASGRAVLTIWVRAGEQPYYTARHVGKVGSAGSNEIVAYGIGKKRADGHVDRLWALPTGEVTCGDDVDDIGIELVEQMGPRRDHDADGNIVYPE